MLHACPITVLTKPLLVSKDACDRAGNVDNFSAWDKGIKPNREMRIARKATAYPYRVADFIVPTDRREGNVVDLGIGAPNRATGGGHLELARQIVELRICDKSVGQFLCQRRGVDNFVVSDTGERAAGDVTDNIATRPFGREPDAVQSVDDLGN